MCISPSGPTSANRNNACVLFAGSRLLLFVSFILALMFEPLFLSIAFDNCPVDPIASKEESLKIACLRNRSQRKPSILRDQRCCRPFDRVDFRRCNRARQRSRVHRRAYVRCLLAYNKNMSNFLFYTVESQISTILPKSQMNTPSPRDCHLAILIAYTTLYTVPVSCRTTSVRFSHVVDSNCHATILFTASVSFWHTS